MDDKNLAVIREKIRHLKCVQAGWAFGVPPEARDDWLDQIIKVIKETTGK